MSYQKTLKSETTDLVNELTNLEVRIKNIHKKLIELRKSCPHKNEDNSDAFIYNSTNMHNDFYKCTICGYIKKR